MSDSKSARLRWLGHACYHLTSPAGVNVLIDPIPPEIGYPTPELPAIDVVLVSHQHFDHNYVELAPGTPELVRGTSGEGWNPRTLNHGDVAITVIGGAYHDDSQGAERGRTAFFSIQTAGVRLLHLGDLGHRLDANLLAQTKGHDVVCVPVGGFFTIDAAVAGEVLAALAPRLVIPMHYKTERIPADWPIQTLDESGFLSGRDAQRATSTSIELEATALPAAQQTVVLRSP